MAAIILNPRVVLTDDTGTFATPAGDGTVINNALFQTLQDRIDNLFTRSPFTLGGTLTVEGFGTHLLSGGGVGRNSLAIRNAVPGTTNSTALTLGNDLDSLRTTIWQASSTFGSSVSQRPDALHLNNKGSGGIALVTEYPSAPITFTLGDPREVRFAFRSDGNLGIGTTTGGATPGTADSRLQLGGYLLATGGVATGLQNKTWIIPIANGYAIGEQINATFQKASTGTHPLFASLSIEPPAVTGGAATITTAATLYVNGGAVGAAANYAIFCAGTGLSYFVGGARVDSQFFHAAPTTGQAANCWIDPANGLFWRSTSARKYKKAIAPLEVDVETLLALEPVTFQMIDDPAGIRYPGLIADDVAPRVPLLVDRVDGAPESVRYDRLACYLLVVLRALDARVAALEGARREAA